MTPPAASWDTVEVITTTVVAAAAVVLLQP